MHPMFTLGSRYPFTKHKTPWKSVDTKLVIGHMKMRNCTVRGYESWQGMHAALTLAGSDLAW